jgi:hypothetical protein
MSTKTPHSYTSSFGLWHVDSLSGDCEGRSTRDLGIHGGHIDEIAKRLAGQCYYGLRFRPAIPKEKPELPKPKKRGKVHISLGIESGTWPSDMSKEERVQFFRELFQDRPVEISDGTYYSTVEMSWED